MINWHNRVGKDVKEKVDIDLAAKAFRVKYQNNLKKGFPENRAAQIAMKEMITLLEEKGVKSFEATHFLHVCEVLPYGGCGCCEHRKNND